MTTFVDRVTLHAAGGSGGHGVSSVLRSKFKPLGGPDGGNGGDGGEIRLVADANTSSLVEYHHGPHRRAGNGGQGEGDLRHGKRGEDVVVMVPPGTMVLTESGEVLADLVAAGHEYVVARGGRGGLGNAALASAKRRAPGFALKGEPGEARDVVLELKSVADVALVGYPSAGKSSLIAALSAARPKIADYPFTTLIPNLGVVSSDGIDFTVADVPGLIPGASAGRGLGLEFLRHVERCSVLVHVLDCATLEPDRDPQSDLATIEAELRAYEGTSGDLTDRPSVVALNKIDVPEARELAEMVAPVLRENGYQVFEISSVSHEGLPALTYALAALVTEARARTATAPRARVELRARRDDDSQFRVGVEVGDDGVARYRVTGAKPTRWVNQTDFGNDEAVGYLADRLARLGVEDALRRAGAVEGDQVLIGPADDAVVFDWVPSIIAGAGVIAQDVVTPRGTDPRVG